MVKVKHAVKVALYMPFKRGNHGYEVSCLSKAGLGEPGYEVQKPWGTWVRGSKALGRGFMPLNLVWWNQTLTNCTGLAQWGFSAVEQVYYMRSSFHMGLVSPDCMGRFHASCMVDRSYMPRNLGTRFHAPLKGLGEPDPVQYLIYWPETKLLTFPAIPSSGQIAK